MHFWPSSCSPTRRIAKSGRRRKTSCVAAFLSRLGHVLVLVFALFIVIIVIIIIQIFHRIFDELCCLFKPLIRTCSDQEARQTYLGIQIKSHGETPHRFPPHPQHFIQPAKQEMHVSFIRRYILQDL